MVPSGRKKKLKKGKKVPGQTKCGPSPTPLQGKPCWLRAQRGAECMTWICSVKVFQLHKQLTHTHTYTHAMEPLSCLNVQYL